MRAKYKHKLHKMSNKSLFFAPLVFKYSLFTIDIDKQTRRFSRPQ